MELGVCSVEISSSDSVVGDRYILQPAMLNTEPGRMGMSAEHQLQYQTFNVQTSDVVADHWIHAVVEKRKKPVRCTSVLESDVAGSRIGRQGRDAHCAGARSVPVFLIYRAPPSLWCSCVRFLLSFGLTVRIPYSSRSR